MPEDIRKTEDRGEPKTGSGDGAAYGSGYGAGGLGSGADRARRGDAAPAADAWDAPGVAPDGRRTGSPTDGPRVATDGEGEPDPDPRNDAGETSDG